MVEHIRGIGRNDAIVQATVEKVREQSDRRMADLEVERLSQERELKQLYSSVEKLVRSAGSDGSNGRSTTDQLADLQDRIRTAEQRVTGIREEVIPLERQAVGEGELSQMHVPSGTSVDWYASNDGGDTWESLALDSTREIDQEWTEYTYSHTFADPAGNKVRYKAELTGNRLVYPRIHTLGATLS